MARGKIGYLHQAKSLMTLTDYSEWFLCYTEEKYSIYVVAVLSQIFVGFSLIYLVMNDGTFCDFLSAIGTCKA